MRLIDADRFYINYARRFSREPLKVEFFKQFLDAEPTVDVLKQIRDEIVEEQSTWREDADAEWHECRRILRIIDKYKGDKEWQ